MERIEASERRIADRESAPEPRYDAVSDQRDRREQIRDHGSAPETHLTPGQRVAEESRGHHQQQDDDAEPPEQFAWSLVRPVVQPAKEVDIDDGKEHRGAGRMNVSDEPSVV